jgi:hypothetical protein
MAEYDTTRDAAGRPVVVEKKSNMGWLIALLIVVALVVAAFAFGLIDIDQTKETKLPDVNVSTTGGQAPAFDVDTAKVDVGTKKETIEVPTIDVDRTKDSKN